MGLLRRRLKSEDAKLFATVLTDYILDKKEVSEC